jgi:hypothetical protein
MHRSATQRATRRPAQSNRFPRSEPIRHGQTIQLCYIASPGRPHWPSDLAASHLDGPPGPTRPGSRQARICRNSACLSAHMYAGQRINLHGRRDRSLSPAQERLARRLGGEVVTAARSGDIRVIISAYPIGMNDYLSYYLALRGPQGLVIFDHPSDHERFRNWTAVRVAGRRSAAHGPQRQPGGRPWAATPAGWVVAGPAGAAVRVTPLT